MELKEFIKRSLIEITSGVKEANKEIDSSKSTFVIERYQRDNKHGYIQFDVAVTVSNTATQGGSGEVKIHVLEIKGNKGGEKTSENSSRIQFSIMPAYDID